MTGSTSGIGRALAESLAAAGVTVGIVARGAAGGEVVQAAIAATTGSAVVRLFVVDLSSQADVRRLATEVTTDLPRLDVLVHCAAVFTPRRTLTAEGLETMFATNQLAPFLLRHAPAPLRWATWLVSAPRARAAAAIAPSPCRPSTRS